jgi:peptidoglycan hydrolase-like protein with peptidoglycan-binding domain
MAANSNTLLSDERNIVRVGPRKKECMFLASKIVGAGIVFILLTTWISGTHPTPRAPGANLSPEERPVAHENDVQQVQQSLQAKGHYRGKVDGVIGLRTRASIRSYQKAENLPVTGELDTRTADKLGVEPEPTRGPHKAGREVRKVSDSAVRAIGQGKPSAGIKWAKGREPTSKKPRKEVSSATPVEDSRRDIADTLQAKDERRHQ